MSIQNFMIVVFLGVFLMAGCASDDVIYFDPGLTVSNQECPESMEGASDADRAMFWWCDQPSDSSHCCKAVTSGQHCHSYNCSGSQCANWCATH